MNPSWALHSHDLTDSYMLSGSTVSDSLQPHRLQSTRLLCPWDSPGKNTGVGCHVLVLQGTFLIQGLSPVSCIGRWILYHCIPGGVASPPKHLPKAPHAVQALRPRTSNTGVQRDVMLSVHNCICLSSTNLSIIHTY